MIKCDNGDLEIVGRKKDITGECVCIISRLKDVMTISDIKFSILAGLKSEAYRQSVLLPKLGVLSAKEFDEFVNERLDKFTERYDRNLKAEAIKEFADRLGNYKEYRYDENCDFVPYVRLRDIEKVEKEMVGAEK